MKKLFLIAAAAAMVLATGCVKTNNDSDQTRIVVKLHGASIASGTRAVEAPAEETDNTSPVTVNSAWVFVISGDGVYSEPLIIEDAKSGGHAIGAAQNKIFPSDSKVYVLGNLPTNIIPSTLTSWDAIVETEVNIGSSTNYKSPVLANATGEPVSVNVDPNNEKSATVDIEISPLYSRLELWKITGGRHIVSFNVAGVYINKYYPAFTLAGAGAGTQKIYEAGATTFDGLGDSAGWTSTTNGVKKPGTGGAADDIAPRVYAEAGANASRVWAYNVGAGSVVGFVIRLTNVKYYPENEGSPGKFADSTDELPEMFLLVNGYNNLATGAFARGTIYRVKDLVFDYDDLVDEIKGVGIKANVDVLDWTFHDLNPILGE